MCSYVIHLQYTILAKSAHSVSFTFCLFYIPRSWIACLKLFSIVEYFFEEWIISNSIRQNSYIKDPNLEISYILIFLCFLWSSKTIHVCKYEKILISIKTRYKLCLLRSIKSFTIFYIYGSFTFGIALNSIISFKKL